MSVDVNFHLHRIRGDTCIYKKGILMSRDRHENQSSLTSSVPLCLPPGTSQKAWPAQVWSVPTALLKFKILFIQLALVQYSLVTRTQQKIRKEKKGKKKTGTCSTSGTESTACHFDSAVAQNLTDLELGRDLSWQKARLTW